MELQQREETIVNKYRDYDNYLKEYPDGRGYFGKYGGVYMDEGSVGIEVRDNIFYHIAVPLFYHNQIIDGYKKVSVKENYINCKPGTADYRDSVADFAGLEFEYQDLLQH